MSLKSYSQYKDSEIPWVDKIPDSWSLVRNKQLFQPRKEVVGDRWSEYDLLSLTLYGIVKRDMINPKGKFPAEFNTYQIVRENDFVFCLFDVDETPRTIGVSPYHGMITGAYTVFEPKLPSSKFLYYYYLHLDNHKALKPIYTGLRKVITEDKFLHIKTPFPTLQEQEKIIRYLDWKTSQISRFIKAKKRQIDLLKEQKQIIINDTVTGKIDVRTGKPYPKYKNSGVEWIEKIPEDWVTKRMKDSTAIVLGKMLKTTPASSYVLKPYLRSINVQWFTPSLSDVSEMYFSKREMDIFRLQKNDLLICEGGETGRCCIWKEEIPECYIQNSVHKVTCRNDILPEFLLFQFQSIVKTGYINSIVNKVSIAHLTREKLVRLPIIMPSIEYQKLILQYISVRVSKIDLIIDRIEREISKIQEFRASLVADVVLGKVDVQGTNIPEFYLDNEFEAVEDTIDIEEDIEEEIVTNE